ncbi:preprotein translocase subunit YajC [Hymenobacter sp. BT18]|uniref:preprotein translocase subunit YajC n=1 Tax=Hymenobacter sp. BT18 TaxID=2835648 RepID=UPI00143E71D2|nr:preprotein translocase subunit YajC [Hymenobacter sp. BT18]QIX61476.1 preprotein translocase subunit YajC [Hymenobacter sp. BT18]
MFLTLLLQAAPAGENYTSLLFPVVIAVIVYFFMIRPQQRRASEAKKFRESIAKGTNVVTIGGLHGKVVDVTPETVVLEVERGLRLRFDRSAVARQAGTAAPAATTEPTA